MRALSFRLVVGLTVLILTAPFVASTPNANAQTTGDRYVSPTYGFTVSWPNGWFMAEETQDPGMDYLFVSDGADGGQFLGLPYMGDPELTLVELITMYGGLEGMSGFEPLRDDRGVSVRYADKQSAYAIYRSILDLDGFRVEAMVYFGVVDLVSESTVAVIIDGILRPLPEFSNVVEGFAIDGEALPVPVESTPAELNEIPATGSRIIPGTVSGRFETTDGEPAPVFVDGNWRFAVAAAVSAPGIPSLELEATVGRVWVVLVADLTNWSDREAEFSLRDPLIQSDAMPEPWDIAPASTRKVARKLDLRAQGNESVTIAPGQVMRIVLVYSIPEGGGAVTLTMHEAGIELDPYLASTLTADDLPPVPTLPVLESGTITRVAAELNGDIILTLGSEGHSYRLLGVEASSDFGCMDVNSFALTLVSQFVEIEVEPVAAEESAVYVWLRAADGTRTLLNQQLIAAGSARYAELLDDARFSAWFAYSEQIARENSVGVWGGCDS